jgi:uncharacterized protein (DUF433 family)
MSERARITFNSDQCGGRACVRGMRIGVKDVLELLATGSTRAEILAVYPYLEDGDITAPLEYGASQLDYSVIQAAS